MATIKWKTGTSGDFDTAGNWTPGQIPATADNVEIIAAGTYTVTSSVSNTVNTLEMAASATLAVTGGTFAINDGSGPSGLAGTITVADSTTLSLAGAIDNTGTIRLNSTGDNTDLRIASPIVTLEGGGSVILSNNAANRIYGNSGAYTLDNVDNIISGAGQLGAQQLTLINAGQIVANQTVALVINTGNFVQNTGIIKSTSTAAGNGGLVIQNTSVDDSGNANAGKIEAVGAHTHVDLNGATIIGGTLITSGGGIVQTVGGGGTLDGVSAGVPLKISGTVLVTNSTVLTLDGVIDNTGVISLAATVNNTDIHLNSQTVTLEGGGKVTLNNNADNRIYGNNGSFQLVNVDNTISGAGQLGAGQLALINQAKGVIVANQATALTLSTGGNLVVNTGLLEDTGKGGLVISNTTVDNASGTIEATGAGAHVDLAGAYIEGGTLTTAAAGKIQTVSGGATLDGLTIGMIKVVGTVTVTDQTTLTLVGIIDNTGTIAVDALSTSADTDLRLNSQTVTLEGGGKVTLSNDANNRIFGNSSSYQLVNVDNTISGAGQIGVGQITLINQTGGTVNANQKTALTLNGGNIILNTGLLEATNTGGLVIASAINNATGTIMANGAHTVVDLAGGTIESGTLKTLNGGVIQTIGGNGNFDGATSGGVLNTGTVDITDNTVLTIEGAISNTGTIMLGSGVDNTDLHINSQNVILKGHGKILLSNSAANRIYGISASDRLYNVDNTISGAGQLGVGQLTLINETQGVINANQKTALILNAGGNLILNTGLIEGTNTGGLVIASAIDNAGGTISATGAKAVVSLSGGTIEGGTIKTATGGAIQTIGGNGNLDGVTEGKVTLAGTLNITDNTVLTLEGVINNTGTIKLASVGNNTDIHLNGENVTLEGGGKVTLTDLSTNRIYGNSGLFTLINLNNIISGGGQLGAGQMQFTNGGTINANGTAGLTVQLGSGLGTNSASGLIEGTGVGGLTFTSGLIDNLGRIAALNGSFVTFTGASADNEVNGVLTGGTWQAVSTTKAATLSITGGAVTEDAATIMLSGAQSVFQAGNGSAFTPLEQSLTTIDAGGKLEVLNARGYTTTLAIGDAGLLQLGGGTFKAHALSIAAGGSILGFGTFTNAVADAGTIEAKGGTLTVTGAVTGAGALTIDGSSTLELQGAVAAGTTTAFAGAGSKLVLTGTAFAGTVSGFAAAASESIDLTAVTFGGSTNVTYSTTTHILKVTDGTHSASLHLFQQYVASGFHDAKDSGGGTLITYTPPAGGHAPALAVPHH